MTLPQPYTPHISYTFEVLGETVKIYNIGTDRATVSETRFNGQEDTHQVMDIYYENGVWVWEDDDDDDLNPFITYSSKKFSDAILEYINKHGVPCPHLNPN